MPWRAATSVAAQGRSTTTSATGTPASRMASSTVPLPDASTAICTRARYRITRIGRDGALRCAVNGWTTFSRQRKDDEVDYVNKLTTGDKVLSGGALAVLIGMFLPWFKVDIGGFGGGSVN